MSNKHIEIDPRKVKDIIKNTGYSQYKFAMAAGIESATMVRILSGKIKTPRIDTVMKIMNLASIKDIRELLK